jgi:hypothetical protein
VRFFWLSEEYGLGAVATAARTLGLILPEFVADLFRKDAERGSK